MAVAEITRNLARSAAPELLQPQVEGVEAFACFNMDRDWALGEHDCYRERVVMSSTHLRVLIGGPWGASWLGGFARLR